MLLPEDFTRCQCGTATMKKEQVVYAQYTKNKNNYMLEFRELHDRTETRYICTNCGTLIYKSKE